MTKKVLDTATFLLVTLSNIYRFRFIFHALIVPYVTVAVAQQTNCRPKGSHVLKLIFAVNLLLHIKATWVQQTDID